MKKCVIILFASLLGCLAAIITPERHIQEATAHYDECNYTVTQIRQHITCASSHSDAIYSEASFGNASETSLRTKGGRSHTSKEHHAGNKWKNKFHITVFYGNAESPGHYPARIPSSVEKYIIALERLLI